MTTDTPENVRAYMRKLGSKGGSTTGPSKARKSSVMRKAAKKRWAAAKQAKA